MLRFKICRLALPVCFGLMSSAAFAVPVPSASEQEVLVKTSLLTFNDANLTGNYTVLNAKGSRPFRDQLGPEKLKSGFQGFVDKHIDISGIAAKPNVTDEAKIDDSGILILTGSITISDSFKVTYSLKYIQSDGEWKMIGINVKT